MTNEAARGHVKFAKKEQRVLAAFGDVRGFRSWVRRCGPAQFRRSYAHLQEQWVRFAAHADLYKSLGDGFMAVWDLRPTHNCRLALDLLNLSLETAEEIETIRMGTPEPRFCGWRIRRVGGDTFKWTQDVGRRRDSDYVGQRINLCKELLYVAPDTPVVLHESAWELFTPDQAQKEGLVLRPLPFRRYTDLKLFDEDIRGLKALERARRDTY